MNLGLGIIDTLANYFLAFTLCVFAFLVLWGKRSQSVDTHAVKPGKFLFLGWGVLLLSALLVFRSIYSAGPAVWGDAPYFSPDAFKNFFPEPLVWEARGRLGVVNDLYWIYPLMFIYKGLGALGFSNDLVIRLVFYFPAIFFAILSPWLLTRYLKFSPVVSLFSTLVYVLSTYFILVVDGGQIGVALAYGIFPLALLHLFKLKDNNTFSQFYLALIVFMLLVMADVRFALIALFTFLVWQGLTKTASLRVLEPRLWKTSLLFSLAVLGLSAYWLLPAFVIEATTGSGTRSGLQLISALNPLFLYSPHWPQNEFGKISPIPWYFIGLPLLIFGSLLFTRSRLIFSLIFCFLVFAFLAKGETGLFGNIYTWAVDLFPLGGAFRDSTKFFAPLMLFAGMLVGLTVQSLQQRWRLLSLPTFVLVFSYFLYLVHPAILGNMNGVLAKRDFSSSINVIANKISSEKNFLRTVWFPERHPLAYHTEAKPALDAKSLVDLRPFASLNTGTLDVFNFLHNDTSVEWLGLAGVRYLVFSGDIRKVNLNSEEQTDWDNLLNLVANKKGIHKVDWGIDTPVYEIEVTKPRIFGLKQAVVVVGSEDIYKKLKEENTDFSPGNQGFIFVEDGKTDPEYLTKIVSDSAVLVFNKKEEVDLTLSFLQEYFVSPNQSKKVDWAIRGGSDYLKWKYELLVNNISTFEFDYGKGIAFSSEPGERITFDLKAPSSGDFILAVRSMARSGRSLLKGNFDGKSFDVGQTTPEKFGWYVQGDINLKPGQHELMIENQEGFQVINTVALIPKDHWLSALDKTHGLTRSMEVFKLDSDIKSFLQTLAKASWQKLEYKQLSPIEYELVLDDKTKWVVFTDNYHKDWQIVDSEYKSPLPFYSMVNGFFVPAQGQYKITFSGQEGVRPGLYISLLSLAVIVAAYFTRYKRGKVF